RPAAGAGRDGAHDFDDRNGAVRLRGVPGGGAGVPGRRAAGRAADRGLGWPGAPGADYAGDCAVGAASREQRGEPVAPRTAPRSARETGAVPRRVGRRERAVRPGEVAGRWRILVLAAA